MREGIRLDVLISRPVGDREQEPGKEEGPAGLAGIQPLGTADILKVLMVCNDL